MIAYVGDIHNSVMISSKGNNKNQRTNTLNVKINLYKNEKNILNLGDPLKPIK